jgi:hypothetical protein
MPRAHSGCDRPAEDAYPSMTPDPTFAFVGLRVVLHNTIQFVFSFWIVILLNTMLTSLFDIEMKGRDCF